MIRTAAGRADGKLFGARSVLGFLQLLAWESRKTDLTRSASAACPRSLYFTGKLRIVQVLKP